MLFVITDTNLAHRLWAKAAEPIFKPDLSPT